MSTCNSTFAFGMTGNEFLVICGATAFLIFCFCALTAYLNKGL